MTTATTSMPTASQQAKAADLLVQRDQWRYARNAQTGRSYIAMPSGQHVYQVHPAGLGCSCKGAQFYRECSHMLAARLANDEDRVDLEIEAAFAGVRADHDARQAAQRQPLLRYEQLFPEEE